MNSNPLLGLFFHWIGGLAAGSFYVFFHRVRGWAWEVYWLVGGIFSWVIMPWTFALLLTRDLPGVIARTPAHALFLCWLFGALWGLGSLTAGLAIRYLGMSLGQGVTLGFCAAFGTLLPPFFKGQLGAIAASSAGRVVLAGVAVSLLGIAITAMGGLNKEREMPEARKRDAIKEFSFGRGMLVATFAGIMSGFMSFGLDAGVPLSQLSIAAGTPAIWSGLPKVVIVLLGGFSSNVICCVVLGLRNRSLGQSLAAKLDRGTRPRLALNYLFCALAGTTWYFQYLFYTMGESQMGAFRFSSWTLHMASIIIFSTLWGWVLREWQGSSRRTHALVVAGMTVLVFSTLVVGYGNYLALPGR